ncbi:hypothetical protein JTB14_016650 [Gonioctena quinquepunctata]|nr:hypothetical protein JTB14_016650 [Gonioctena quinquepunctata]
MSRRSSKMMMALAQKNKSLREKIKVSEKLKRNIQNIDPDFFPSSDDSNDDFPLSRPVSAKQYFAENNHNIIIPNVGFREDYITLEPSTSKIETVNKIQDNQNSKNWDNISIKSSDLLASGSSAISEYNINPTDDPSSITYSNIAEYYYNNENVTNAIPIMSIGEEQNLSYHQLLPVVPENDNQEIITNSSTVDHVDSTCAVLLKTNDEEILHTTDGYNAANDKPLKTASGNIKDDSVSAPADKRCTNTPHNKIDDGPIKEHIFSFEPSISHYRREHAPNRLYLPSDLSITHLHTDFVEKNPSMICSYDKYRKVLQDLNISFVKLGHEECEECEEFDLHDKTHNKDNIKKDCECCTRWASHIERAERSRNNINMIPTQPTPIPLFTPQT